MVHPWGWDLRDTDVSLGPRPHTQKEIQLSPAAEALGLAERWFGLMEDSGFNPVGSGEPWQVSRRRVGRDELYKGGRQRTVLSRFKQYVWSAQQGHTQGTGPGVCKAPGESKSWGEESNPHLQDLQSSCREKLLAPQKRSDGEHLAPSDRRVRADARDACALDVAEDL